MADKIIQLQSSDGANNLFPKGDPVGIDTGNILSSSSSYTATQDCIVVAGSGTEWNSPCTMTIDGIKVGDAYNTYDAHSTFTTLIKKDQVVLASGNLGSIKFYGLKY